MPKPFLTPEFTSEDWQCRTLRTPNNKEWLGVFNSALLEMTNPYNWQQVETSDLTISDAIEIVEGILTEFFDTQTCGGGCLLPEIDVPPFRLGVDGHYEMLDPSTGEWGAPTGEYEIPPTPPREESTGYDRRCGAAANAANVMEQLYEAITDAIALGGDALQVAAALIAAAVTAIGGWIAAPLAAIIDLTIALFAGMIELLQVLGSDVWTEEFDERLKCALFACASSAGDVVTFDLTCIREQLTVEPDLLNPNWFYELQLFAQIVYLMETITMDGLNAAGATTGVTVFDCEACSAWCYTFDFTVTDGDFAHIDTGTGTWSSGVGWVGVLDGGTYRVRIDRDLPYDVQFTGMELTYDVTYGSGSPAGGSYLVNNGVDAVGTGGFPAGTDQIVTWYGSFAADYVTIQLRSGTFGDDGSVTVKRLTLYGTGDQPFGDDNCE